MADDAVPDPRQSPSVYARHGGRWSIYQRPGEWTAHRLAPSGKLRFATATTEAELAGG